MTVKRIFAAGAILGAAAAALLTTAPGWLVRTKIKDALRARGFYPPRS